MLPLLLHPEGDSQGTGQVLYPAGTGQLPAVRALRLHPDQTPPVPEHRPPAIDPQLLQTLTQAALETLAVVAYRQPITRMEVEQIRGVQCDRAMLTLVKHGLIEEVGRKESIGRPILYGTTERFLQHFALSSLEDLPKLEAFVPDGDLADFGEV